MRLGALFLMIPAFGGRFVPNQIRVLLVFMITIVIVPTIEIVGIQSIGIWQLAYYAVGEILLGFFMGVCVRALFAIVEVAGQLISRNMGLMMAEQFDPASGSNSNLIGVLLFYFTTILFFMIGGHHQVLHSLVQSFSIVPMIKDSWVIGNFQSVASILSQVFALAISISAPFIAVNFIITLGFGVLGKVAPKDQCDADLVFIPHRRTGSLIFLDDRQPYFQLSYCITRMRYPDSMLEFLIQ